MVIYSYSYYSWIIILFYSSYLRYSLLIFYSWITWITWIILWHTDGESSELLNHIEPDHPRTIVTPQNSILVPVWGGLYVAFQLLKKRKPRKKQVVRIS